jgi:selenide,water dikinase
LTKAHRSNLTYTQTAVEYYKELELFEKYILTDPQTSGGLLLSVSVEVAASILNKLQTRFPQAAIIGHVKAQTNSRSVLKIL